MQAKFEIKDDQITIHKPDASITNLKLTEDNLEWAEQLIAIYNHKTSKIERFVSKIVNKVRRRN